MVGAYRPDGLDLSPTSTSHPIDPSIGPIGSIGYPGKLRPRADVNLGGSQVGVEVEMLVAPVSSANSHTGKMEGPRAMASQPLSLISAGTTSLRTVWQTVQLQRANERWPHQVDACSGNTSPLLLATTPAVFPGRSLCESSVRGNRAANLWVSSSGIDGWGNGARH